MKRIALSIAIGMLSASAVFAQTKSPVEGVWKVAEVTLPSASPAEKGATTTISNPQPGLIIFTRGYYSGVAVTAEKPRAAVERPKDPQKLTDAEKIARFEQWREFDATSGPYEIKGTTLSMRAMVAKGVRAMTSQTPLEMTFKLEGTNTLWLMPPAGATGLPVKFKLTRLE